MLPILPNTPPNSLIWRIVHFPPVLLVIALVMLAAGRQFVRLVGIRPQIDDMRLAVPAAMFTVVVFLLVYWLFVRFVERRRPVRELGTVGWVKELGAGLLVGAMSFSVVIGIIAAYGGYRVTGYNPASVVFPVLVISLKSGVVEEIMMRGLLFRIVERSLGSWIAILVSAALFGAGHLANPGATWWSTVAVGIEGGLVSAGLYMLTRRLWAAIGEHIAWNFTQGGLYGIPISGFALSGVLQPRLAGSDALTGGSFGVEASVPGLVVEIALGVALLVIAFRRDRFVAPFWARSTAVQPAGVQE